MATTLTPAATSPLEAASTPAELFFSDLSREMDSTRRLLACIPDGQMEWRPHPRSRTLGALAMHVAELSGRGALILGTDDLDVAVNRPRPPVATTAELLAIHDEGTARLTAAVAGADAALLAGVWTLHAGPQVFLQGPRRAMLRIVMLSHQIHHRAQLGMYLRLLNVPIPGMYGPSADEGLPGR